MSKKRVSLWDIKRFEEQTEAFSIGFKQDFVTFVEFLAEKKIPLDHAVYCISGQVALNSQAIIKTQQFTGDWRKIALKCEKCGKIMALAAVNTAPGNMVGGKYKSQWFCPDIMNCGHYLLSRKTMPEVVAKQRRKANYSNKQAKDDENG